MKNVTSSISSPNNVPQEVESESRAERSQAGSIRSKQEFSSYLAREGAKTERLQLYSMMKEAQELEPCTFKPQINKYRKAKSIAPPSNDGI